MLIEQRFRYNKKVGKSTYFLKQMVQMAGIEPARFIQPRDFKNFTPSVTYQFLLLFIVSY